jgi:hypothetical protein
MNKLEVVSLESGHIDFFFDHLEIVGEELFQDALEKPGFRELAKGLLLSGRGIAILKDGELVGGGGLFVPPQEGFGMSWAFISPAMRRFPKFLLFTFRRYLAEFQGVLGVHEVRTLVRQGVKKDRQFAERLGFEKGDEKEVEGRVYDEYVRFNCVGISQPQAIN